MKLNAKTVKVLFERPKFTLLGQTFSFGPKSSVELETPCFYANKIRVGRGSLGSLFVFTVDEKSQRASVLREVDRTPRPYAAAVLVAIVAAALYALRFLQVCPHTHTPPPLLSISEALPLTHSLTHSLAIAEKTESE